MRLMRLRSWECWPKGGRPSGYHGLHTEQQVRGFQRIRGSSEARGPDCIFLFLWTDRWS